MKDMWGQSKIVCSAGVGLIGEDFTLTPVVFEVVGHRA